jgi:hypothetical protein
MPADHGGTLAGHRSDTLDPMNKDQILGPLREIAFAAGVALVTFGVTSQATVELVSGVLLALVSLIYAIGANEGPDVILSLFRKILSGVAGGLVAWGKLDPAKAEALTGFALVLISSAWSFRAKGGGTGGDGMSPLWVLAVLALMICPSCVVGVDENGWSVRPDPKTLDTGLKYLIRHEDDGAKSGGVEWVYFDPATGKEIPPSEYAAWGIKP